jgi:hypothetical protein
MRIEHIGRWALFCGLVCGFSETGRAAEVGSAAVAPSEQVPLQQQEQQEQPEQPESPEQPASPGQPEQSGQLESLPGQSNGADQPETSGSSAGAGPDGVARPPASATLPPLPQDPPSRVGRIAAIDGQVSVHPHNANDWQAATRNWPVTTADALWSDQLSKVEVQIGTLAVRLSERTSAAFNRLDDSSVQLGLAAGVLNVHVLQLGAGELVEVDLPVGAVTLRQVGSYRIEMDPQAHRAEVVVRRGSAEILVSGSPLAVPAHRAAHWAAQEGESPAAPQLVEEPPTDGFDRWCAARDERATHPQSLRHLSAATVGYQDLDDHGSWSQTPEYGAIWRPSGMPDDWAPYHAGRWAYVSPWGWTWIDDASWGFAPFHYGRWVYYGGGWGWTPGGYLASPCYSPALVAFTGGVGVGIGVGLVTWFPLGPREIYVPAYATSYGYVRNVNVNNVAVSHTTNITSVQSSTHYINRGVPGAVTQVPRSVMQHGQGVGAYRLGAPSPAALQQMRVQGAPSVGPPVGVRHGASVAAPPAAWQNHPRSVGPSNPVVYRSPGGGGRGAAPWTPARAPAAYHVQPARVPSPVVYPAGPPPSFRPSPVQRPSMPPAAGHYVAPRPSYTGGQVYGGGRGGASFAPGHRH